MNDSVGSNGAANALYEFPLRDSIRLFLRLEVLDRQLAAAANHRNGELNRTAVHVVLSMADLVFREDLRAHLLQQIYYLQRNYKVLRAREDIRQENLKALLDELEQFREELVQLKASTGRNLRFDPLISALRQRDSVTDAAMAVDLPVYQWWLQAPPERCREDFLKWVEAFGPLLNANRKFLALLRERGEYHNCEADQGSFVASITRDQELWMVRIGIPKGIPCFPQASGASDSGKIHVRFLETPSSDTAGELYRPKFAFMLAVC